MRCRPLGLSALTLLVLTTLPGSGRAGDASPYKGAFNFTSTDVEGTPVSGVLLVTGTLDGTETHLGRFTGEVRYYVDTATGEYYGTLVKVAANGDELFESLKGQFTPTGSYGDFTLTGGTGRFTNARGDGTFVSSWVVYPSTAVVKFDGRISYDASDRRR